MQDSTAAAPENSARDASVSPRRGEVPAPQLLVYWEPAHQVFARNLLDLLLHRHPVQPWITARPAEFWPDVFVNRPVAWRNIGASALYHVFFVIVVYGITLTWFYEPVKTRSAFEGTKLTYYPVSEYLPEIDTGSQPAKKEQKGEPALAKQKIMSIPTSPDNRHQTIVTPDPTKIASDVPMPNIVAWNNIPAPPEAAMRNEHPKLEMPKLEPTVVPPPADIAASRSRLTALPAPEVIGPAADPHLATRKNLPNIPGPDVVGPAPSLEAVASNPKMPYVPAPSVIGPAVGDGRVPVGSMNIAHADIGADAAKLAVVEQRAVMTIRSGSGSGMGRASGGGAQPTPPPVPTIAGSGNGKQNLGQLIALGLNPVAPNGPITVPRGSRAGEFAAGPEGKAGAPGTPDIQGGSNGAGGSGAGSNGGGHGASSIPAGISVAAGPPTAVPGPVAGPNPAPAPARQPNIFATVPPSRMTDIGRIGRPGNSSNEPAKVEDKIFGSKKIYSMTLNMPSLVSAGGSYIIRFAELGEQRSAGELTAPIAMLKVDPAYPAEIMRERVEGTVTLYAIIHKDGSVGAVRVLRGVDERLDHNAEIALARWQFRPATKNGEAVELETVVQIPFVAKRNSF